MSCVGIRCKGCSSTYYRCYSKTWNISGTVTRRRGYCESCCGGSTKHYYDSGHTVDMRCKNCDDKYNIITWTEWKKWGDYYYSAGYCGGCYNKHSELAAAKAELAAAKAEVVKKTKKHAKKAQKIVETVNEHFDDSKLKEDITPEKLTTLETNITTAIQNLSAAQTLGTDVINNSKLGTDAISSTPTFTSNDGYKSAINNLKQQQQTIANAKQKTREAANKINDTCIQNAKAQKGVQSALIEATEKENILNDLDNQISEIQKGIIDNITGDDVNTNRDAIDKLNTKVSKAICLLKEKHAENTERIHYLNDCETRINKINIKLQKAKCDNKYLMQSLSDAYKHVGEVEKNVMQKWEERGTYFLSVTVGLKEDLIDKFIDEGYEDLEDIKGLSDSDLIEIGFKQRGIRKKILREIENL